MGEKQESDQCPWGRVLCGVQGVGASRVIHVKQLPKRSGEDMPEQQRKKEREREKEKTRIRLRGRREKCKEKLSPFPGCLTPFVPLWSHPAHDPPILIIQVSTSWLRRGALAFSPQECPSTEEGRSTKKPQHKSIYAAERCCKVETPQRRIGGSSENGKSIGFTSGKRKKGCYRGRGWNRAPYLPYSGCPA